MRAEALKLGRYYSKSKKEWQVPKIAQKERSSHFYIVGATRMGKSKFLEFLISQDIGKNGFALLDPHGDLVEEIKSHLIFKLDEIGEKYGEKQAQKFYQKIVVIDPTNPKEIACFNPLENIPGVEPYEQALELVGAFKKIWSEFWGPRMENLLRSSLICLIENNLTLLELPYFLTNQDFRVRLLEKTSHAITRDYFLSHFEKLSSRIRNEWMESTLDKVNAFLSDDRIRLMLSSPKSTFSFREIMDNKKILLVNLTKGKLKDNSYLLGSLILTNLWVAALSRSDMPKSNRIPFYLFIDEFQNFASESFCDILSEAAKYGLYLTMAHQNLGQLSRDPNVDLQGSIMGNTGIQVYFRVSHQDVPILAKECFLTTAVKVKAYNVSTEAIDYDYYTYQEEWERYYQELITLPRRCCYVKHKLEGGIIKINTEDMPDLWEDAGYTEEQAKVILDDINLGRSYFVSKNKLEKESQKRLKQLLQQPPQEFTDFRE